MQNDQAKRAAALETAITNHLKKKGKLDELGYFYWNFAVYRFFKEAGASFDPYAIRQSIAVLLKEMVNHPEFTKSLEKSYVDISDMLFALHQFCEIVDESKYSHLVFDLMDIRNPVNDTRHEMNIQSLEDSCRKKKILA